MSLLLTTPIFPKWANIGAIFWATVPDVIQQVLPPVIQIPEASTSLTLVQPPSTHSLTQEAVAAVWNEGTTKRVQQYVRWNWTVTYIPRAMEYRWGSKQLSQWRGYCYLVLFKQETWNMRSWLAYPILSHGHTNGEKNEHGLTSPCMTKHGRRSDFG